MDAATTRRDADSCVLFSLCSLCSSCPLVLGRGRATPVSLLSLRASRMTCDRPAHSSASTWNLRFYWPVGFGSSLSRQTVCGQSRSIVGNEITYQEILLFRSPAGSSLRRRLPHPGMTESSLSERAPRPCANSASGPAKRRPRSCLARQPQGASWQW